MWQLLIMGCIGSHASLSFPDLKNLQSSAFGSCKSTWKIQDIIQRNFMTETAG
jgi:hypothetical protein